MKIVRPICYEMDVHKNLIVATIGITDSNTNITEYIQESFSTLNPDLLKLKQWLKSNNYFDVCMETGKYWIPIFNVLEDEINVYLTHSKYVKAIKGKKTDKKDSKWIYDLFKHDLSNFLLSHQRISVNYAKFLAIVTSLSAYVLQKETDIKIL